jgi:hypothetical protein
MSSEPMTGGRESSLVALVAGETNWWCGLSLHPQAHLQAHRDAAFVQRQKPSGSIVAAPTPDRSPQGGVGRRDRE